MKLSDYLSNFTIFIVARKLSLEGRILEGNTGKKGVAVPQYKGATGANENIVKADKLGEQTKENRKYDKIQKGGGKKGKKKKHRGGCGCQERF